MADSLYLRELRLKDVRALGEVHLEFPAEPGLVVLEGPNGLGKSTLFEAILLALGGNVARWEDIKERHNVDIQRDHLQRAGVGGAVPTVELTFGAPTSPSRQASWTPDHHTPAMWLCPEPQAWSLTTSTRLSTFLRATHFVPQSPHLRFLHTDAKDRWDTILSQVSGYAGLQRLSERAGQGTKSGMTRQISARAETVATAKATLQSWRDRVATHRAYAQAGAARADACPPSQLAERLPLDAPPDPFTDTAEGARSALAALAARLEQLHREQAAATHTAEALTGAADLTARWEASTSELVRLASRLEDARAAEVAAREALTAAEAGVVDQTASVESAAAAVASASSRAELAKHWHEASQQLATLDAAPPPSKVVNEAEEALRRAHVALAEVTDAATRRAAWEAFRFELQARQAELDAASEVVADLEATEAALAATDERREAEVRRLNAAARTSVGALATHEDQRRHLSVATAAADVARAEASELRSLVIALARHVHDDDHHCPLCDAEYPGQGELLGRVRQAIEREGADPHESILRAARDNVDTAAAALRDAEEAAREARRLLEATDEERASFLQRREHLRGSLPDLTHGRERSELDALLRSLQARRTAHDEHPDANLDPLPTLRAREDTHRGVVETAQRALESARADERRILARITELHASVDAARSRLDVQAPEIPSEVVAQANGDLKDALTIEASARALRDEAIRERDRRAAAMEQAASGTVAARADLEKARDDHAALESRWRALGLNLPPADGPRREALETASATLADLQNRTRAITSILDAIERWIEDHARVNAATQLDQEAGGTGAGAWARNEALLASRVSEAERAHQSALAAKSALDAIDRETSRIRTQMYPILKARLSPALESLLEHLLVNPDLAMARLELTEDRKRSRADARLKDDTPVVAHASEGELAGVNLAIQLAMALTFRWSRWPAVLLDDPAQYADVVHTANLAETLRTLARAHGFQVFLATHERDQADYLLQKFRNDGLAATHVAVREPRDPSKGVRPFVLGETNPVAARN